MDPEKLKEYIEKMVHPDVTVNSLTMFANRLYKKSEQEGLRIFWTALCRLDIYKAALVTRQLDKERRSVAEKYIAQVLAERCESEGGFSYVELLAIAACKDATLLETASPLLTMKTVNKAMRNADSVTACNLLRLSLAHLPEESCIWVRKAFCGLLFAQYDERMERALPELMPCLLEQDAPDVLSALVAIIGAERVSGFYGKELPEELDRLILSGKDSVGAWELFFYLFFQQEHTQEELLEKGLWYVQLFASDDIYDQACASFFLHTAIRYGVEHPALAYMEDFSFPEKGGFQRYFLRYKDAIRPLWQDPCALARFLEKTAPCNPFRKLRVQAKRYRLLQTAQDRTAYDRLQGLFEAELPAGDVLNVFFSTDLKRRLPLEDVFYLAQRYEVLPGLLEALQDRLFIGTVASQEPRWLFLSPHSYFTSALHGVPLTYKVLENIGHGDQLKGLVVQYTITGFVNGYIRVSICGAAQLGDDNEEDAVTWEMAIDQLRQEKDLRQFPEKRLQQLSITEFTLDDVIRENGIDLFTGLLLERPDCLEAFLELLHLCKWNASFLKPELQLPKGFFSIRHLYQQKAEELFRFLLETREDVELVLQLYFSSIYRAIVPLSQLLLFAPRERLMEHLPDFQVCCRLYEEGSARCRPDNVSCAPVCSMESTEGLSCTDPFTAVITDFTVVDKCVSSIVLQPYQMGAADIKERGALFGYLTCSIHIGPRKAQRLATLPSAADCDSRELKFNMHRTEDAILLRRSNAEELKHLIQTLGDANPFAFGVSFVAERRYLSRKERKEDTQDSAVSMILNARNIEDIRDFYLHTYIKYHLQLPQLAALIRERRTDLDDQLPEMFEGVTFRAIADSQGKLWMPWVAQNTLQVSSEYAGRVLSCGIRMEKDGRIDVNVSSAEQNEVFFDILDSCLLSGYRMDPDMTALVERLEEAAAPEDEALSLSECFCRLRRMLYSKPFSHEKFGQAIQRMIVSYGDQPVTKVKSSVINLTEKWLDMHADKEKLPQLLEEICCCFAQQYQDARLSGALIHLLYKYLGKEQAQSFKLQLQESAPAPQETKDGDAEKQPSLQSCEDLPQLQELAPAPQETKEGELQKQPFTDRCENLQQAFADKDAFSRWQLKRLLTLIRAYHELVSREEMEAAVSALTEQWMQRAQNQEIDDATLNELLNVHRWFIQFYQSGSLGLILCRQAYQYMPEIAADKLERGICKTTYKCFGDQPELEQILPPFEERFTRLQSRLQDPRYPNNDAVKRINRLICHYSRIVSAAQMKQAVLALTEQWISGASEEAVTAGCLFDIHKHFIKAYASAELDEDLCRLLEKHQGKAAATAFAKRLKGPLQRSQGEDASTESDDTERI